MVRVAFLDDHPAVLAGLRRLIDAEHDLTVSAAAPDAAELAKQLDGRRPDVILLDFDLVRGDGLSQCRRIKDRPNPPGVIIYSSYAGPALTLAARAARADGVVTQAAPVAALAFNSVPIDVLVERLSATRVALDETLHDVRLNVRVGLAEVAHAIEAHAQARTRG